MRPAAHALHSVCQPADACANPRGHAAHTLLPSLVVALPAEPSLTHGRDVTPARC